MPSGASPLLRFRLWRQGPPLAKALPHPSLAHVVQPEARTRKLAHLGELEGDDVWPHGSFLSLGMVAWTQGRSTSDANSLTQEPQLWNDSHAALPVPLRRHTRAPPFPRSCTSAGQVACKVTHLADCAPVTVPDQLAWG